MKAVGARLPRYDGVGHVTGRTRYVDDVRVGRTLWVKALRSPHDHAATRRPPTRTVTRSASRSHPAMRSLIGRRGGVQKMRSAHSAARRGEVRCTAPNAARVKRRVALMDTAKLNA